MKSYYINSEWNKVVIWLLVLLLFPKEEPVGSGSHETQTCPLITIYIFIINKTLTLIIISVLYTNDNNE